MSALAFEDNCQPARKERANACRAGSKKV